jgi:hypothetical protein
MTKPQDLRLTEGARDAHPLREGFSLTDAIQNPQVAKIESKRGRTGFVASADETPERTGAAIDCWQPSV